MTYAELEETWRERDVRLATRRYPLEPEEVAAVRAWRHREADEYLDGLLSRFDAFRAIGEWEPPLTVRR